MIYDPGTVRVKLGALLVAGIAAIAAPVVAAPTPGTSGADDLKGTKAADDISGRGGNDALRGLKGNDKLRGGSGDDQLKGSKGKDRLLAGGGADVLIGGKGNDTLNPGKGEDGVNMNDGVEMAAPGRDVIRARDGEPDQISCGDGNDKAIVDAEEEGVYDCETVVEPAEVPAS